MILSFNNGFGDQVQALVVVKEMLKKQKDITVVTKFPELWEGVCPTVGWRSGVPHDKRISYIQRRPFKETTQFQDVCIEAGISPKTPFSLEWETKNTRLINDIREDAFFAGKTKICAYKKPYLPMGIERFRDEMTINGNVIEDIIKDNGNIYFLDVEDHAKTVTDVLDILKNSDILMAQLGHFVCIGEAFDKKTFIIYSSKMRSSEDPFVRNLVPFKTTNKSTTICLYDDDKDIVKRFKELLVG